MAQNTDSLSDRLGKLLPGDVTAAFLSAKAALIAVNGEEIAGRDGYVFWTFVAIAVLCPVYFWFVTGARTPFHLIFLTLSFCVFAVSIADAQFTAYLQNKLGGATEPIIKTVAIVLPILWTFLVTQISVAAMGQATPAGGQQP
jgi:hypothetical protein